MWIQIKGFPFGLRWGCGSSSTVCMKVLVVSDSIQLDKLGDVALLLCGWFQVWDWGGIKALEPMPKTYFSWDELRVVPFEMLEERWRNTISLYQLGGSKWSRTVLVSHHGNEKLSCLYFVAPASPSSLPTLLFSNLFAQFPSQSSQFLQPLLLLHLPHPLPSSPPQHRAPSLGCFQDSTPDRSLREDDMGLIQSSTHWCLESFETHKLFKVLTCMWQIWH